MADPQLRLRDREVDDLELAERLNSVLPSSLRREAKRLPKLSQLVDVLDVIGLAAMFAFAILTLNILSPGW